MSIQFKRGTADKRKTNTSVLDKGQPFFETDTNKLYMGDGATALKSLKPIVESSNNEFTGDNVFRGSSSFFNSAYFGSGATFSAVANATFGVKGTGYYLYQTDVTTNNTAQLILGGTTEDSTTTSYKVGTIVNKQATLTLPTTTGTVALTNDIDVTAAGNNTFTGTNTFSKAISFISSDANDTMPAAAIDCNKATFQYDGDIGFAEISSGGDTYKPYVQLGPDWSSRARLEKQSLSLFEGVNPAKGYKIEIVDGEQKLHIKQVDTSANTFTDVVIPTDRSDTIATLNGNQTFSGTNKFSKNIQFTDYSSYIIAPGRYGKYCKLQIGGNGTSRSSDQIYSLPETSSTSITLAAKNIDNNFTGTQTFAVPYNFSTNDRQGIVIQHVAQNSGQADETYYKIGYSVSSNSMSTYYMPSLCLHTSTGSTSKEIVYTLSASRATGTYDIATSSDITTKLSSLFTYSNNVLTINI